MWSPNTCLINMKYLVKGN